MVYIHIPFCCSFCTYCDFYSEISREGTQEEFVSALCEEIGSRTGEIAADSPDTVYIGGGTPSVLPLSLLERICGAVSKARKDAGLSGSPVEFTVEVNPEDIVLKGAGYVGGLRSLGVDRISMGVQSFDDSILKWMNRRHDADKAIEAYRILSSSGIRNISIDLIFGLPQLDDRLWGETLDKAVALKPAHMSAYQLSVEPGSLLASMVRSGKYSEASEQQCRRQYDMLCEKLASAGYRHYEISNFALPGYEAVHNSSYWRHVPYTGFGPGAHSFSVTPGPDGNVPSRYERKWNAQDLKAYTDCFLHGGASVSESEVLDDSQVAIERTMLGLRTDRGVEASFLQSHAGSRRLEILAAEGLIVPSEEPGFLRIPEKYFFISDNIISDLV